MEGLMRREGGVLVALVVMVGMLTCAVCKAPELHKVGGKEDFGFDKRYYNVLEVNKTNYEQCNDHDFITNITRGGRDVFNLTEAKPYYFISSGGYCFHGMKLTVEAEDFVPSPEPSPAKILSTANAYSLPIFPILLAIGSVCAFLLKLH
ncbi:unnamed protein product [Ilex paraguariensis]|uniref:Phytocyanin domain-containing protein n=1 Tax=Ilex paraguariensis TaxID=185542 RepID=A0ABC8T0I9_9AQUA